MTGTGCPAEDLRRRWMPAQRAVRHGRALLAAEPDADLAVVPLYQPGKQYGIWLFGQPVQTVEGVVFPLWSTAPSRPPDYPPSPGRGRPPACSPGNDSKATDGAAQWPTRSSNLTVWRCSMTSEPSRDRPPPGVRASALARLGATIDTPTGIRR